MSPESEPTCTKCGKPLPKAGSMTQWIIDPTRCACTPETKVKRAVCALCELPLKASSGTITQWIFKAQTCSCMNADAGSAFFPDVKIPEDEAIVGAPYHFISVAAHGGLGTVFRAENKKLRRPVAIKVLTALTEDARAAQNFMREAKSSSMLQHPNLQTVLDFGTMSDGRRFLVTEWIEGLTLAQFLTRHGKLSIETSQAIFSQVLDGLSHAHNRGVVHRDIKPSNIMLTRTEVGGWFVKIIDFGTAKEFAKDSATTRIEEIACSPFYMSPEQSTGSSLDQRSDLYSLGCTLFEALTSKPPFTGRPLSVVMRHQNEAPPSLTATTGTPFPASLEILVETLLSKNPSERYQSAENVKEELLSIKESDSSSHQPDVSYGGTTGTKKLPIAWMFIGLACAGLISATTLIMIAGEKDVARHQNMKLKSHFSRQTDAYRSAIEQIERGDDSVVERFVRKYRDGQTIERIDLHGMHFSKDGLSPLTKFKSLKELDLRSSAFPDSALEPLKQLPIQSINLANAAITDRTITRLVQFRNLDSLNLEATTVSDGVIPAIIKMKKLRLLQIGKTRIGSLGVARLAELPHLELLSINQLPITENDIQQIAKFRSLKTLGLDASKISAASLTTLAKLPNLEMLMVSGTDLNSDAWSEFRKLSSLTMIEVIAPTKTTLKEFMPPPKLKKIFFATERNLEKQTNGSDLEYIRSEMSKRFPKIEVAFVERDTAPLPIIYPSELDEEAIQSTPSTSPSTTSKTPTPR